MKRFIIILACAMACVLPAYSQADTAGYRISGKTLYITKTRSYVNETVSTGLTYQDAKGNQYLVYQSKGGKFYVLKESAKTGKEYKYYLPAKLQKAFGEMVKNLKK